MNKTRLAEKRYRDKLNKDEKEIRLNGKNLKNKMRNLKKLRKTIISINNNYKKQKRQQN